MVIELLHISQYVARERRARARLGQVLLLLLLLLATAMLLMLWLALSGFIRTAPYVATTATATSD